MKHSGSKVYLRAVEPEDIDVLYSWENNTQIWEISNTVVPFSKAAIRQYLETAGYDIYTTKQLRLIVCLPSGDPIGTVDLFDFDPAHRRAGIGILISDEEHRRNGYASEVLDLLIEYAFLKLHLHQLYCNILSSNDASIQLFTKKGFEKVGLKRDWILSNNTWKDELMFQLINPSV